MPTHVYISLSMILFLIGAAGVLLRRNALIVLMGIELMLNAGNLAFLAFARSLGDVKGNVVAFFIIALAAAEAAVGLAILVGLYRDATDREPGRRFFDEARERAMFFNLKLIPLLPFAGAAILMLFGRKWSRPWVHLVATLAIGASCLVSLDAFFVYLPEVADRGGLVDILFTWMRSGDLNVNMTLRMDTLSGLMCLVITFIGTLIHIYSTGYMSHEDDYARFFAYLNLFCGSMLILVLGDSLPVMFIGWEGVGLCSYLLIGFWYGETANADAGKKAFITNRVGDFGFLLGMFLLFYATGTLDMPEIIGVGQAGRRRPGPAAVVRHAHRRSGRRCSCSSAPAASRPRSRCTSGCPTPWPAPPRCRR